MINFCQKNSAVTCTLQYSFFLSAALLLAHACMHVHCLDNAAKTANCWIKSIQFKVLSLICLHKEYMHKICKGWQKIKHEVLLVLFMSHIIFLANLFTLKKHFAKKKIINLESGVCLN